MLDRAKELDERSAVLCVVEVSGGVRIDDFGVSMEGKYLRATATYIHSMLQQ